MNLEILQQKVPEIRAWIDRTLVRHREQACSTASFGFPRLGSFFPADLLASAKVILTPRVPLPPLTSMGLVDFAEFEHGSVDGITYLDTYFVRADAAARESLHFHELVHVVQWQHLGPDRFLIAYALGYLAGGGYRGNPLEVMAYELEDRFDRQAQPFDAPRESRRLLDRLHLSTIGRAFDRGL